MRLKPRPSPRSPCDPCSRSEPNSETRRGSARPTIAEIPRAQRNEIPLPPVEEIDAKLRDMLIEQEMEEEAIRRVIGLTAALKWTMLQGYDQKEVSTSTA